MGHIKVNQVRKKNSLKVSDKSHLAYCSLFICSFNCSFRYKGAIWM